MASRAIQPPQSAPLDVLLSMIPSLPRAALARLAAYRPDGPDRRDTDIEANGDELDGEISEDAFGIRFGNSGHWAGPGCPISDPDSCIDDTGEMTDERETEPYDGGYPDIPFSHSRMHVTA